MRGWRPQGSVSVRLFNWACQSGAGDAGAVGVAAASAAELGRSDRSNKQVMTFGTELTTINSWHIDRVGSLDRYQSSRGSISLCFFDTDKENRG